MPEPSQGVHASSVWWLGMALFALASAAFLVVGIEQSRRAVDEASSPNDSKPMNRPVFRSSASASASTPGALRQVRPEEAHWKAGIQYFQNGDNNRAAQEWKKCLQTNPDNEDCRDGLKRLREKGAGSR